MTIVNTDRFSCDICGQIGYVEREKGSPGPNCHPEGWATISLIEATTGLKIEVCGDPAHQGLTIRDMKEAAAKVRKGS